MNSRDTERVGDEETAASGCDQFGTTPVML